MRSHGLGTWPLTCWSRLGADFLILAGFPGADFLILTGFLGADFFSFFRLPLSRLFNFNFFGNTDVIGADFFSFFRVVVDVKTPKISRACRNFNHVAISAAFHGTTQPDPSHRDHPPPRHPRTTMVCTKAPAVKTQQPPSRQTLARKCKTLALQRRQTLASLKPPVEKERRGRRDGHLRRTLAAATKKKPHEPHCICLTRPLVVNEHMKTDVFGGFTMMCKQAKNTLGRLSVHNSRLWRSLTEKDAKIFVTIDCGSITEEESSELTKFLAMNERVSLPHESDGGDSDDGEHLELERH